MDTIAWIMGATEYARKLIPPSAHSWAIPLVALVITAAITVLFVDQPFTVLAARTAIMQWLTAIGVAALVLRARTP